MRLIRDAIATRRICPPWRLPGRGGLPGRGDDVTRVRIHGAGRMYHPPWMSQPSVSSQGALASARAQLRERGMRWTPQRRALIEVLLVSDGHLSGAELVERCRALDPETTPSTVYRTLDALEEIGLVRHSHGHDGREEFHVRPRTEHGHLRCEVCGSTWEIDTDEARRLTSALVRSRGFALNLSHLTIVGRCAACGGGS
jgi:Fur family ferric uptake transcriptional regulator